MLPSEFLVSYYTVPCAASLNFIAECFVSKPPCRASCPNCFCAVRNIPSLACRAQRSNGFVSCTMLQRCRVLRCASAQVNQAHHEWLVSGKGQNHWHLLLPSTGVSTGVNRSFVFTGACKVTNPPIEELNIFAPNQAVGFPSGACPLMINARVPLRCVSPNMIYSALPSRLYFVFFISVTTKTVQNRMTDFAFSWSLYNPFPRDWVIRLTIAHWNVITPLLIKLHIYIP